jgi:hypothetical protein
MPGKYDPEIRAKAVRPVLDHRGDCRGLTLHLNQTPKTRPARSRAVYVKTLSPSGWCCHGWLLFA